MPDKDTKERYVVQKATAATLDFAAVMATASRVYAQYDSALSRRLPIRCVKLPSMLGNGAQKNPCRAVSTAWALISKLVVMVTTM